MTPATQDQQEKRYGRGHIYKAAIQNSFMDFCSGLGKGTDRIADVIVDTDKKSGESAGRKVGRESVAMIKNIARDIRDDMAEVSFRGIICDASYGIGRLSRKTRDLGCRKTFNDVTRTTGKVSGSIAATDFRSILHGASHGMGRLAGATSNAVYARS